jgi:predicted nucleic acid-binding Zn ribbon protein
LDGGVSELERLGEEAQRELARFEPSPGLLALVAAWPRAVGDEIARNAWPARLGRDGTLHVSTSSSTWAFELTQLEREVLGHLKRELAQDVPKQLRFAPGPLPSAAAEPAPEAAREPLMQSAKARSEADSLVAEIENEELRAAVARAAAASLERSADDRSV